MLEIGCGKGEFLALICELGGNTGIGIDPAYVPRALSAAAESRIEFITDFYSEKYSHLTGDVVCLPPHAGAHRAGRASSSSMVRRTHRRPAAKRWSSSRCRTSCASCARAPSGTSTTSTASYFSLGSLARLFRSCGFEVLNLYKDFDDQYLLLEARPSARSDQPALAAEEDIATLAAEVEDFAGSIQRKFADLKTDLDSMVRAGQKVVVWGSGSKAVAYLSTLKIRDEIEFIVDINPVKHGKFLAGTGHEIVAPEFLQSYRPDVVILMNPIYFDEVQRHLAQMDVPARLVAV